MTTTTATPNLQLRAKMIASSAARLQRLVELNAPALIIENERWLLVRRVAAFPCTEAVVIDRERVDHEITTGREAFLSAHGYYNDDPTRDLQA